MIIVISVSSRDTGFFTIANLRMQATPRKYAITKTLPRKNDVPGTIDVAEPTRSSIRLNPRMINIHG
jgi:hypothetical protein